MLHLLNRFSFQSANWNSLVILALVIIWVSVIACVISSILGQPFDRKQRIFWIAIVILIPPVGILAYLPFAFRKEDLPHIFLRHRKRPRKGNSRGSSIKS